MFSYTIWTQLLNEVVYELRYSHHSLPATRSTFVPIKDNLCVIAESAKALDERNSYLRPNWASFRSIANRIWSNILFIKFWFIPFNAHTVWSRYQNSRKTELFWWPCWKEKPMSLSIYVFYVFTTTLKSTSSKSRMTVKICWWEKYSRNFGTGEKKCGNTQSGGKKR